MTTCTDCLNTGIIPDMNAEGEFYETGCHCPAGEVGMEVMSELAYDEGADITDGATDDEK